MKPIIRPDNHCNDRDDQGPLTDSIYYIICKYWILCRKDCDFNIDKDNTNYKSNNKEDVILKIGLKMAEEWINDMNPYPSFPKTVKHDIEQH